MTIVDVVDDDITRINADGLVTTINSGGAWFGGLDRAIQRTSGLMFHAQARAAMPLTDGAVVYAPERGPHGGKFDSVLFVVDDLRVPLYSLVTSALEAAEQIGLKSVSIPTIRTGVMAGIRESRNEAIAELARAINDFVESSIKLDKINVVVYRNKCDKARLRLACGTSR